MANRYFGGNSLAAFFRTNTAILETTTAGRFDSAYVESGITLPSLAGTEYIQTYSFNATGTVWLAFEFFLSGGIGSGTVTLLVLNGTTNVFRLDRATSTTWQAQYWNGSAWTNTGSAFSIPATLSKLVVRIDLNSGFTAYIAGTQVATGSGWSGSGTTITNFRLGAANATVCVYSQVMCADYDLRDSKFMAAALTGDSAANTNGTGAYTTINETVLDESSGVSLTASADKRGQTHAAITVPAGYVIGAAVLNARGRVAGTITDGKLGFRSGGTNYSSSGKTFNGGYEPRGHIIEDDPATATRFTQSGFNAAETYLEAV